MVIAGICLLAICLFMAVPRSEAKEAPPEIKRTHWALVFGFCHDREIDRRYECPRYGDFRSGKSTCSGCQVAIPELTPMSSYQADTNGSEGLRLDPNGSLVSSLLEGQWEPVGEDHVKYMQRPEGDRHAPIFDLDYPVELDEGTLVLHQRVSIAHAQAVIEWLESQDLSPLGSADAFMCEHASESPDGHAFRVSEWLDVVAFPLSVPAKLYPSRTPGHFHLYLDVVVIWEQYVELMRRLADAGLIQQGWYQMNLRRKMGMLRRPPGNFTVS